MIEKDNNSFGSKMNPEDIPSKMLSLDPFSSWLGIEILELKKGFAKLGMRIRKDMLNSMGKAHGGISFSLAASLSLIPSFSFPIFSSSDFMFSRFAFSLSVSL